MMDTPRGVQEDEQCPRSRRKEDDSGSQKTSSKDTELCRKPGRQQAGALRQERGANGESKH